MCELNFANSLPVYNLRARELGQEQLMKGSVY